MIGNMFNRINQYVNVKSTCFSIPKKVSSRSDQISHDTNPHDNLQVRVDDISGPYQ